MTKAEADPWEKARRAADGGDLAALREILEAVPAAERTPERLGKVMFRTFVPWEVTLPRLFRDCVRIFEYLHSLGADLDWRNERGETFLCRVCCHNTCGDAAETREPFEIFDTGVVAHPQRVYALFLDLVRAVVRAGAGVNLRYPGAGGRRVVTALWRAAMMGDRNVTRILLEAGADPNIGEGEHSPLARAAEEGRGDILDLLLTHGATEERVAGALAYLAEAGKDSAAALLQGLPGRPR